jgi:hypothetical protein
MKRLALGLVATCLVGGALVASEEDILPPRKVALAADGGKALGEVSATLEAAGGGADYRVTAITLTVAGKTYAVPKEQFDDLRGPLIGTAEFRREPRRAGDPPYLYLTFRLAKPGIKSVADRPTVYIRFRDGKLLGRTIHDPQPDNT